MGSRGHVPPPGMMRHGPFLQPEPVASRPVERPVPLEVLENKVSVQSAEIERLVRENQRLAVTHVELRRELVACQQELQRLQAHLANIQADREIQVKVLIERMAKMKANLQGSDALKADLQQAHTEAKALVAARQELSTQVQQMTNELQIARLKIQDIPTMRTQLEESKQEHQKLRSVFEHEKNANMEQVAQMQAMENNLVTMAREVEKLRAEVSNAEKRSLGPTAYGGLYNSENSPYPSIGGKPYELPQPTVVGPGPGPGPGPVDNTMNYYPPAMLTTTSVHGNGPTGGWAGNGPTGGWGGTYNPSR